ncbi:MAG: hypothetical protein AABZ61_10780, partial [Bacteroidota bacterium]
MPFLRRFRSSKIIRIASTIAKIKFDLARTARISLKVYNLLGQQITTLIDEVKQPGSYEVLFNARSLLS